MIAEPQTIVWLPTLHRLAVSETGTVQHKNVYFKRYFLSHGFLAIPVHSGKLTVLLLYGSFKHCPQLVI